MVIGYMTGMIGFGFHTNPSDGLFIIMEAGKIHLTKVGFGFLPTRHGHQHVFNGFITEIR
jgi:hypothetical protein